MVTLQKKQVKIISVLIALVFVGSVVSPSSLCQAIRQLVEADIPRLLPS